MKRTFRTVKFMAGTCSNGWLVRRWGMSGDDANPHNREFASEHDARAYAADLNKRQVHRQRAYGPKAKAEFCTCRLCPCCGKAVRP